MCSTPSRARRPGRGGALQALRAAVLREVDLREVALREAPRLVLWLPVALGVGIGIYFAWPVEPAPATGPAAASAALLLAFLGRRHTATSWPASLLVAAAVGFTAAQVRTRALDTVMLERETWAEVEGRIAAIERRPADRRLTLRDAAATDVGTSLPSGLRITVAGRGLDAAGLRIGDRVRLRARLRPPAAPVAPDAFDFQRDAYFRGIGAVGFAVGPVLVTARAPPGWDSGLAVVVDRLRDGIAERIRSALPGPSGAVAAAMLVGDRAAIDAETDEAFRATGLTHLLSISGLHMGMVAGAVFAAVRLALACWPPVALRRPIKKWAAAAALAATTGYLLLSGAPVPAQRAFMMTALVLSAVLLDRDALSLHLVAWAAAAVLLLSPESLVGPSFQLSFAAVVALVAAWEGARHRRAGPATRPGPLGRAVRYVGGVAATSVVASAATAPIIAHHFQQVPLLGAAANVAAVPITAFVTMPAGAIAVASMPFGLERWPLAIMGWGLDATLWLADRVASLPLTAVGVTALGTGPLICCAVGGLWLALWRSGIRWLGIGIALAGLALAAAASHPDALFAEDGALSAVRLPGRGWLVSSERGGTFLRDAWRRRWGGGEAVSFAVADAGEAVDFGCDGLGCVLRVGGRILAMPSSPEAAREDCLRADVVVAPVRLHGCPPSALVVDRGDLSRGGAHAVWLKPDGVRVRAANDGRGRRPWVVSRHTGRRPPPPGD